MLRICRPSWIAAIWAILLGAASARAQHDILLAEDLKIPRVTIAWPVRDGGVATFSGERRYQSSAQKRELAPNIDVYVGLGGTRLDRGKADRRGAVVQVGLYKQDPGKPFFRDIKEGAAITIRLDRVVMNRPAAPVPRTSLVHMRYMLEDLQTCGLGGEARNLILTADKQDPVLQTYNELSARPGSLDGSSPDAGRVETRVEQDGAISLSLTLPYALLRHTQDPYQRTTPGGFFEPNHFHFEIELMPAGPAAPPPEQASASNPAVAQAPDAAAGQPTKVPSDSPR
ncbi:MAG: hypothetical protein KF678_05645 [Phycisphaeraceae bacterium]|nr:hypothetical protein [Phycisphaeraceae bacterium]